MIILNTVEQRIQII